MYKPKYTTGYTNRSEKSAAIERNKPKTMSLALPGWGDWTGPNIKMSNTKAKRFRFVNISEEIILQVLIVYS